MHPDDSKPTHRDPHQRASRLPRYGTALLSAIMVSTVAAAEQPKTEIPPPVVQPSPVAQPTPVVVVPGEAKPASDTQVVITANRSEQDLYSVPQSLSVATSDDIGRRQPNSPSEALREETGLVPLQALGHRFKFSPIIRGRNGNRYIAYLWNGVRISAAPFEQSPLGYIDRIEVIRGPAGSQYGSDAMAGVINVITRQPAFTDDARVGGDAYLRYGSVDREQTGSADLVFTSDNVTAMVGATYQEFDDYVGARRGVIPHTSAEQLNLFGDVAWSFAEGHVLRLSVTDNTLHDADFYVQSRMNPNGIPRMQRPIEDRDIRMLSYDVDRPFAGVDHIRSYMYFHDEEFTEITTTDTAPVATFTKRYQRGENAYVGGGVQGTTPIDVLAGSRLTYGIEDRIEKRENRFELETIDETTNVVTTTVPTGTTPDSTLDVLGIYLLSDTRVVKDLSLNLGARFETAHFRTDPKATDPVPPWTVDDLTLDERTDSFTWNAGMVWWMTDELSLAGLVATGFRIPNFGELAAISRVDTNTGVITVPSPDLEPETSITYQLSPRFVAETFQASVTGYWTMLDDVITTVDQGTITVPGFGTATARRRINGGSGYIRGIEAEAAWEFIPQWTVFSNFTVTRGENTDTDQPLDKIPPPNGISGLHWEARPHRLWFEGVVQYAMEFKHPSPADTTDVSMADDPALGSPSATSPRYRSDSTYPGWAVVHLRAGYVAWRNAVADRSLTLLLSVNNVFDTAYREAFSTYPVSAGTDVVLGVQGRF
jgi:hemoglobin/transferrin/lactoferrin receptor protein